MEVTYIQSTNNLSISCHPYEADYPRSLPNRKYVGKLKVWLAPCIRVNAQIIHDAWFGHTRINVNAEAREAILKTLDGSKIVKEPFPSDFKFKKPCYPHQKKGLDYIYSLQNSALFVEMGLGKSKMALDKIGCHYLEGNTNAILVVCPCSIRFNWIEEIKTHCPVEYEFEVAELKTTSNIKAVTKFINYKTSKLKILIVGVESLQAGKAIKICSEYIAKHDTSVVVDEAHTIKTYDAARTKNLIAMSRGTKYRMIMTGTPVSQGILDLYGQFQFLDPNIIGIGDFYSYKYRYTISEKIELKRKNETDKKREVYLVVGHKNISELMEIIRPFVFQCTKAEALELPDKIRIKRYVTLTKDQLNLYNEVKTERVALIPNTDDLRVIVKNVLSLYMSLQQIVGGFVSRGTGEYNANGKEIRETIALGVKDKNPKIMELKSIIDELPDGEQVIIWAKYRAEVFLIAQQLERYKTDKFEKSCAVFLDKTDTEREQIKKDILDKKVRYFISTAKSGGTGLTMNTAAYVVYFSNSFSQLEKAQSEDRNHRIGQKRNVTYIDLVAKGTVDENILTALRNKKNLSDYVKDCLKNGDNPLL